ncbi:MAG TPA: magnesium-translocating P-type ATPase [Candidatus Binatus sp.]|uniref:magnesium-translocating P-type ATPase n=1 Tax=Candidatus Binatus sp. TaxID=2811406 RepID=UPI002B4A2E68|nr:magnesium-translocating P-type ATPase [Candidatus Binatus sp.]HKN12671.1 magnesium-translocating P-type ATPase [Candidatus Binatus sp.]
MGQVARALQPKDTLASGDESEIGLSGAEAERRFAEFGPNEPVPAKIAGPLFQFLRFCANPLVLILLIASAISTFLGQVVDAIIIAMMVVLSVVLNFIQAYRSERAVQRLRDQVAPTATVKRDGNWIETPRRQIVPSDVVRLSAGDLVPADARLIRSQDLHVQQAALTGESMPVEKYIGAGEPDATEATRPDLVFLGTSVVSGTATALVLATGPRTSFGDIAARLSERPPETEFDRGTRQFGILIMKTVFFLVLFILMVSIGMHRNALESLLFAVALAVGLTPEFLPMITTVTLSMGAIRMARSKVIVKHLDAIENLGSIDLLCSDKTGTLTSGEMELDSSLDPFGEPCERALFLGYRNSRFESGIKSPLDACILKHPPPGVDECEKTDEIPFDFERRRLSIVVRAADGACMLITKGAPEGVLEVSTSIEVAGNCRPLGDAERRRCIETFRSLSASGLRVLAVAYRQIEHSQGLKCEDERDLVFAGFLTFLDPVVEGVAETIVALHEDGVGIKILTGDNELVTKHVCERVGIDSARIVLGAELERMTDSALFHVAEEADVFARVSPGQKNRIIRALKSRGHVVGFLGDGINDAPSLHAADVGISVAGAVDVARDAADIILLEHALDVLHGGIIEGRKAFGNVLKYILMGTSSNFGNMFSMAAATLFLPFLPMLPTQILLNNFLYDLAQVTIPTDNVDPAYVRAPQKWNVRIIRNFMIAIGPISSIFDFLTFYILLTVFRSSEAFFHTGWFVESLATQTLVLFVIRTAGRPWSNRPSLPLASTTILIVIIGLLLPFSPLAGRLGFVPLPAVFFLFLLVAVIIYLILVEIVKARLVRSFLLRA